MVRRDPTDEQRPTGGSDRCPGEPLEMLYRALAANLPGGAVFLLDRDLRYVIAEGQALATAGFTSEDLEGRTSWEVLEPALARQYEVFFRRALGGEPYEVEHSSHGREYLSRGVPIRGADGRVDYVLAVSYDITERKRAEEALRYSEAALDAVLEALPVGVVIADAQGRIVRDNAATRELWGGPPDTGSWEEYGDWVGWWPDTGERIQADEWAMTRALVHGEEVRNELVQNQRFDTGERRFYLNNVSPLRDAEGRIVGGVAAMLDVTDRLAAERELRESERKFATLFHHSPGFAFMSDAPTGEFMEVNEAYCALTGYSREELLGHTSLELGILTPEERSSLVRAIAARGRLLNVEVRVHTRSGEDRVVVVSMESVLLGSRRVLVCSGTDISERKQAEEALRELNATLERRVAERTNQLERHTRQLQGLALELSRSEDRERRRMSEILHDDLQQQLASARFHLATLRSGRGGERGEDLIERLEVMLSGAIETARGLSHDLSPGILRQPDLFESFRWLAEQMRTRHGLDVHVVGGRAVIENEALRSLLYRAGQELLFNVVKHARVTAARVRVRRWGRIVGVAVSDRGRGFVPAELGDGSGFGLLSIRERVELLGGRMRIESRPGQGSRFTIAVPVQEASELEPQPVAAGARSPLPEAPATFAPAAASEGRTLRLVIADDHELVRQGLAGLVAEHADLVLVGEAANGREAVDLAWRLQPDVVVMDVSMPVMSGVEATRQIARHMPGVRVIALSMFADDEMADQMRKAGAEAFLSKSAASERLVDAIRRSPGR